MVKNNVDLKKEQFQLPYSLSRATLKALIAF
jgi:hypothetical protein